MTKKGNHDVGGALKKEMALKVITPGDWSNRTWIRKRSPSQDPSVLPVIIQGLLFHPGGDLTRAGGRWVGLAACGVY